MSTEITTATNSAIALSEDDLMNVLESSLYPGAARDSIKMVIGYCKAAGLDPNEYTGFYVNIGLDRLVMMRYGVDDVRLFHSADLRFLKQFH